MEVVVGGRGGVGHTPGRARTSDEPRHFAEDQLGGLVGGAAVLAAVLLPAEGPERQSVARDLGEVEL